MPKKTIQRPPSLNKKKISKKRGHLSTRTLYFPLVEPLRELRRAKFRVALQEAACLAIEGGFTRELAINDFDNLLVAVAVENFPGDIHLAALVLEVPDLLVATRWNGLKNSGLSAYYPPRARPSNARAAIKKERSR